MIPDIEVEQTLERLGQAWPANESLVDRVLQGLESQPAPSPLPERPAWLQSSWLRRAVVMVTAVAVVIVVGVLMRPDHSLYAQVRNAVRQAKTFQMTITSPANGDKAAELIQGLWYERGVGFRQEFPGEIMVGDTRGTWRFLKGAKLAIQSKGNSINELMNRIIDTEVGRQLEAAKYERHPAGDQTIEGQPCQAYWLTKVEPQIDQKVKEGKLRLLLLLDDKSRAIRIIAEVLSGEQWVAQVVHDCRYDLPIDHAKFEPRFGDGVRLVDADAAFGEFADPDKALYREERAGLIFAIHQARRFEGGLFVMSSVRGTDETLKKYPLTQRRLGPTRIIVDGPATHYRGSQEPDDPGLSVELASMDYQGIHARWWVLVPFTKGGDKLYERGATRVKIPVGITPNGGEYGKAKFADAQGVIHHLTWDVEFDVSVPATLPTLDEITRDTYADFVVLDAVVPFKYLNMGHRGMTPAWTNDPSKIAATDFMAAAADDIRWWQAGCPQDDPRSIKLRANLVVPD